MTTRRVLLVLTAWVFLGGCNVDSQSAPAEPDQQLPELIQSLEGPDLFRTYCAACHGLDAKGKGPAAPALKTQVADLTVLTQNNGGRFPSNRVRETISGDRLTSSHGSREMPVWGPIFHQVEADTDWGNVRLENLVKFLESIQSSSQVSGADLYKQNCAACHGNDLKGTGPAPEPYQAPPDLTTLARRHGGKFPDAYVADILKNGVVMPAHGLADMPAWGTDSRLTSQSDPTQVGLRITELTNYLKSLQAK